MGDDNLIDFGKILKDKKTDVPISIQARILNCHKTGKSCKCTYCTYRKGAVDMITEILFKDMYAFEKRQGTTFSSYDAKEILLSSVNKIVDMEYEDEKK